MKFVLVSFLTAISLGAATIPFESGFASTLTYTLRDDSGTLICSSAGDGCAPYASMLTFQGPGFINGVRVLPDLVEAWAQAPASIYVDNRSPYILDFEYSNPTVVFDETVVLRSADGRTGTTAVRYSAHYCFEQNNIPPGSAAVSISMITDGTLPLTGFCSGDDFPGLTDIELGVPFRLTVRSAVGLSMTLGPGEDTSHELFSFTRIEGIQGFDSNVPVRFEVIPEPATLALSGIALAGLCAVARVRRRRKTRFC